MADHLTEEQQVEAIKTWWKENGMAVIAGLVIGVVALFGWRAWIDHKESTAAEASALYGEFQKNLSVNNRDAMAQLKEQLEADYASTPYASLVALAAAKIAVADRDMQSAKNSLQWVLDNSRQNQIQHTARVRLLALMMNDAEYDAALTLLTIKDMGGYAAVYEELRGDILLAKGDMTAAYTAYGTALESEGLSPAAREMLNIKYADSKSVAVEKPEMVK